MADDKIPGGKADDRTSDEFDPKELEMGIKVEREHTDDPKLAEEIARDHLVELPDYYSRLLKMEKEAQSRTMAANRRAEKDIIRVLIRAGKEPLAKAFAHSRGYRVTGYVPDW